ncbi:glycoside hydrolase family 30 protein [Desertivirga brevis]|uniref:glycoside hydrolase family 30 protein n=1 Tax=Desertivirga brevis TaxID=2810310 RepID=UPI001A96C92B|nr:glycoside hydrolase family 30 beta sandwich domain-containing protein [Pedobacter sp. SYSU D00873]
MRKISICILYLTLSLSVLYGQKKAGSEVWLTDPDHSILFRQQLKGFSFRKADKKLPLIQVDAKQSYQEIDGFGFALTGGSAQHIIKMSPQARAALLKELFANDGKNIGISYLRVSIGASDLNEKVFTYNDLPDGQTDPKLEKFDLGADKQDVIPVLKEILAINPSMKIMGSPWSPPSWMKTNNDSRGGQLKPEFYQAYAQYFVKYIQAMKNQGIRIDAITIQNEPLHPGNNPSLLMVAPDQALFVKKHLGPAFKSAGIDTKIIVYDHNADRPDYPISILNDPDARQYIDGSAFHLYGGKIDALSDVHAAHPDKHIYFTEQWIGSPANFKRDLNEHVEKLIIGASRNWSRTVIEWNLAADPKNDPHTDRGGCDRCLGGITIDKDSVSRNAGYYIIAHASKFVSPGSVRIASGNADGLPNVAFRTPAGKTVLIVLNTSNGAKRFNIASSGKAAITSLNPGAVGTYIW